MTPDAFDDPRVEVSYDAVDSEHGATPIRRYRPVGTAASDRSVPTLMWVHGGGFFRGDLGLPEAHCVSLAIAACGIPVVSVDYRHVPPPGLGWVHLPGRPVIRFPLPMDDVVNAMRVIDRESGSRFVVGGASAGASLVASAVLSGRPAGLTPLGAVFAYGFFHARTPVAPDIQRLVRGHRRVTHSRVALDLANRNYAGSASAWTDPRAFAGGNDLRSFPPTLMVDAEQDSMRASGGEFARELMAAEVEVDRHVLIGAEHAFLNRPRDPQFEVAIDLIVAWIRQL